MKIRPILLLLFFVLVAKSYGQYSGNYKKLASALTPSKTEPHLTKQRKGETDEKGTISYYKVGEYEYAFYTGKWTKYFSNGQIMIDALYDAFGRTLEWRLYDRDGNLTEEHITVQLDTTAKDSEEFLDKLSTIQSTFVLKRYKFSSKTCSWYLFLEGKKRNNKRIGVWKKYKPDGSVKKETKY